MLDRQFWEWFKPRPGRCATCVHHEVLVDDNDDIDCYCRIEEGELLGWSPGMHLDGCAFPASPEERGCPVWVHIEPPQQG